MSFSGVRAMTPHSQQDFWDFPCEGTKGDPGTCRRLALEPHRWSLPRTSLRALLELICPQLKQKDLMSFPREKQTLLYTQSED